MCEITVSKYNGEQEDQYFFYASDDNFTKETIENYIENESQLKEDLWSLGRLIVYDGITTEIEGTDMKIFHNSSGITETSKTCSIFYILVASETNPANIEDNTVMKCKLLSKAPSDVNNLKVRYKNEEICTVEKKDNTITIKGNKYYVFAVLLGSGKHRKGNSTKYQLELRNREYLPSKNINLK